MNISNISVNTQSSIWIAGTKTHSFDADVFRMHADPKRRVESRL